MAIPKAARRRNEYESEHGDSGGFRIVVCAGSRSSDPSSRQKICVGSRQNSSTDPGLGKRRIIQRAQITIRNATRATLVGTRIAVADTGLARLIGLLGRRGLEQDSGLWIQPSSGVHTFGMRFPIDVVALDRKLRVCALWPKLRPWRISGVSWRIHSVIELPTGSIDRAKIQHGDQLEVLDPPHLKQGG
jgi:uncharacterized membrane protein (UPF0127 family)